MCKKLKEKHVCFIKRFIVWLAWSILKPECKTCDAAETCAYNSVIAKKQGKTED